MTDSSGEPSSTDPRPQNPFDQSSHPKTAIMTLFFKLVAMLSYIFLSLFVNDETIVFIVIVLALAFDFWFVKNVSGRLLVGLRWWNRVLDDGTSEWTFECSTTKKPNTFDKMIFWGCLYLSPVIWVILGLLLSSMQPTWLMLVGVAFFMSVANLAGYWKCLRNGGKQAKKFVAKQAVSVAIDNLDKV